MEDIESRTSRGRFLRQVAATVAAAVGAGALASSAYAVGQCCPSCTQCNSCGFQKCYCHCSCGGIGESYCLSTDAGCLDEGGSCIPCGC